MKVASLFTGCGGLDLGLHQVRGDITQCFKFNKQPTLAYVRHSGLFRGCASWGVVTRSQSTAAADRARFKSAFLNAGGPRDHYSMRVRSGSAAGTGVRGHLLL